MNVGSSTIERQVIANRQHRGQRFSEPVVPVAVGKLMLDGGLGDLLYGLARETSRRRRPVRLAEDARGPYLRVSQINGCAYCIDMRSRDLLRDGCAVEKLVLVLWMAE